MAGTDRDAEAAMPDAIDTSPDQATTPSVTFDSITFSDGTPVNLDPADVVVFVGPNNAGKSAALRELDSTFANASPSLTVLQAYHRQTTGTRDKFADFVIKHTYSGAGGRADTFLGYRWSLGRTSRDSLKDMWPDNLASVKSLFCLTMTTEDRLEGSKAPQAINFGRDQLQHPIHMLVADDSLERTISEYFRNAFSADLIVDRIPARNISLLVGDRPIPNSESDEDRASKTYHDRLHDSSIPLVDQGDGMRSFASVILHLLAPTTASVLLLDEPEAFLHPPQAKLLGEIIATEKPPRTQLFVATHSPDVLQGLVNVASDRLRLLRMQRDGDINRIKELDKDLVKRIGNDPLMSYSSVVSGVFHERVVVCESDSDCMFYSSILDLSGVHGGGHPDALFVHGSGKHRMAMLAETLTALDVPVDVVADIDVIRDEVDLEGIVKALGGDWDGIRPIARSVRTAIDSSSPMLNLDQIKERISKAIREEASDGRELRSTIDGIFRSASPWDGVKRAGASAIPPGDATQRFQELRNLCEDVGLWIVPVGEMEGFCKSVGGHGPGWVQKVIEEKDLATDSELESAREFVRRLWQSRF